PIDLIPIPASASQRQRGEGIGIEKITRAYNIVALLRPVWTEAWSRCRTDGHGAGIEASLCRIKYLHDEVACDIRGRRPAGSRTGIAALGFHRGQHRKGREDNRVVFD